jgi:CMP-N-acetylneuraminic acid synthetase
MSGVVAIILARGGSKGLLKKNIRLLNGRPLISYTIEDAKKSKKIDRVLVSTDDDEIALIAKQEGAEVPFLRPPHLSDDKATSEVALRHAVEWLSQNESYEPEIIVYLQVTEPLRPEHIIDNCIDILLKEKNIDTAFAALETHKNYWRINENKEAFRLASDIPYGTRRQIKEAIYREDTGIALAVRRSVILEGKRVGNHCRIVPYAHAGSLIDIHNDFDLMLAEFIIQKTQKL